MSLNFYGLGNLTIILFSPFLSSLSASQFPSSLTFTVYFWKLKVLCLRVEHVLCYFLYIQTYSYPKFLLCSIQHPCSFSLSVFRMRHILLNHAVSCWYYIALLINEVWIWSTGTRLTGDNHNTQRKSCSSATLSSSSPTWTGLLSNWGLHNERLATKYLSQGTAHYGFSVTWNLGLCCVFEEALIK